MFDPIKYDLWSIESLNDPINWWILHDYCDSIDWVYIIENYGLKLSDAFKQEFKKELDKK